MQKKLFIVQLLGVIVVFAGIFISMKFAAGEKEYVATRIVQIVGWAIVLIASIARTIIAVKKANSNKK